MDCQDCLNRDSKLVEAMVAADKADTDLRCYFLTHRRGAGVSDLDEYNALYELARHSAEQRHRAYLASVEHWRQHG